MHIKRTIAIAVLAGFLLPAIALAGDAVHWAYVNGAWVKADTIPGDFGHGVSVYTAGGVPGKALGLSTATGVHEYYQGFVTPGVYDPTGTNMASGSVSDVDSDDMRNGVRIFVTDASGINEYKQSGVPWVYESTVAAGSGFTAGVIANDQDRVWAIQGGTIYEYDRTSATTWAQNGDVYAGNYLDLAVVAAPGTPVLFALRSDGIDEFHGGTMVRSHSGLFSGANGIATWSDQDNLFVTTTTGLLLVPRTIGGPDHLKFDPANVQVIDGSTGYLDVDCATGLSGTAFDIYAVQVPEPATAFGLLLAVFVLARRRR